MQMRAAQAERICDRLDAQLSGIFPPDGS